MSDTKPGRGRGGRYALIATVVAVAAALVGFGIAQGSPAHSPSAGGKSAGGPGGRSSSGRPDSSSSMSPMPGSSGMPNSSGTPDSSGGAAFAMDHPAASPGAKPCTTVTVLASLENAGTVQALASAYAMSPRDVDGHCVDVRVRSDMSGVEAQQARTGFAAEMAADRPDVWLPDSSAWLALAGPGNPAVPASAPSIAESAVVLAMPVKLAMALKWISSAPTWAQVFQTAETPDVWAKAGHPSWGAFKIGKASPELATSGLLSLAASYRAASGNPADLTPAEVDSKSVQAKVAASELPTAHYMSAPSQFLFHAREAEQVGSIASFLSAMFMDEKTVWDYNRGVVPSMQSMGMAGMGGMGGAGSMGGMSGGKGGKLEPPREKLIPIYPRDGVYVADNPAAVLHGSWVSPAQAAASADFVRFARTMQGQQVVRANGYRDIHGQSAEQVTRVALTEHNLHPLTMPSAATLSAVEQSFPDVRKRAKVLFLLDVSGSMSDTIRGGLTKLRAAQHAVADALQYFNSNDRIGLAAFSNTPGGGVTPGIVSPIAPLGSSRHHFLAALDALRPISETPLYNAVDSYVTDLAGSYESDDINAVILLSDGHNNTDQPGSRAHMLQVLARVHKHVPILVFTLGYGHHSDTGTLQAIASATGAHYYDATNPRDVNRVLADDLVTSF